MERQRAPIPTDAFTSYRAGVTSPGDDTFTLVPPRSFAGSDADATVPIIQFEQAYVVVDDLDGALAVVVVSPWPVLDELGRLRFPEEDSFQLAADAEALHQKVSAARRRRLGDLAPTDDPEAFEAAARPLRVGDAFQVTRAFPTEGVLSALAALAPSDDVDSTDTPRRIVFTESDGFDFWDVTAWARDAAKLAFYAAVAPALTLEEYEAITAPDEGRPPDDLESDQVGI